MKTLTETIEHKPTYRTSYICDKEGCHFKTESERMAKEHEAMHNIQKQYIGSDLFFYFPSEDAYRSFCKDTQYHWGTWEGPGWYGTALKDDYAMGCYMGEIECLYPAFRQLESAIEERETLDKKIAGMQKLLGA